MRLRPPRRLRPSPAPTPAPAPRDEAPAPVISSPSTGALTADRPSFSGTASEAGAADSIVFVDLWAPGTASSGTPTRTLKASRNGTAWTFSWASDPALTPDGDWVARPRQSTTGGTDRAGTAVPFTVDGTRPTVSVVLDPASPDGTNGWYLKAPTVRVNARDAHLSGDPTCTIDGSRVDVTWSGSTDSRSAVVPVGSDGTHTVACTATDKVGNDSSDTKSFKLDRAAPKVDLSTPTAGYETEDTTPALSGAAGFAPNDVNNGTVELWKGTSVPTGTGADRTFTAQASGGRWSIADWAADALPLDEGPWTARSSQRDDAGNIGTSSPVAFRVVAPTLLAAGDIASCDVTEDEATAALLKPRAGVVAPLGDNVYGNAAYPEGGLGSFDNCYGPNWGQEKARTRPSLGNHEYSWAKAGGYFDYFNGIDRTSGAAGARDSGYYSYDHGKWHIVVLNSNCTELNGGSGCAVGSLQEKWLRQDLAAHPSKCTLAYFHHPRFTSGTPGENTAVRPLWQALYDSNAEVVLGGHAHDYERFAEQDPAGVAKPERGIREFVVGTGGKSHHSFASYAANTQIRNNDTFGILQLRLRDTSYSWEFVPEAGKTFTDSGTTNCHSG